MRIGIDARFIGRPGGIGRYTEELVRHLTAKDEGHTYVLFLRDDGLRAFADWSSVNVRKVRAEVPWYTIAEQIRMPGIIDRERCDLVHFPHWNVPLGTRTPFVLTIHDLLLMEHPTRRATTLGSVRYAAKHLGFRIVLSQAVRRARRVMVPSEFVRNEVIKHFPLAAQKTSVIHEGVTVTPLLNPPRPEERERMGMLYVGNAYPHKNLERLLEAVAVVRTSRPDATLTIAGYDDYFFKRLRQFAVERSFAQNIRFIPSPDDATLEELYRRAGIFVIPSRSEGFGLTPLEAMSRGVPVAAARAGSLPEVLGDAALYFNPKKTEEIAAAISRLLGDESLRQELVARGKNQTARYSWDITARETQRIYAR